MPTPVALALAAAAGVLAGLAITAWLRRRPYRVAEEASLPTRFVGWVVPMNAFVTALMWWALSPGRPLVVPVVYVVATWGMVVLAGIDLDVHRLPDAIQLPAYPVLAVSLAACSLAAGDWPAYLRALLAGLAMFALFLVLVLVAPGGGMGFGDAKLAGLLGMLLGWLGWAHVVAATLGTFLLGGVVAVVLLVTRRGGRTSEFAYGPVLLVSAVAAIIGLSAPVVALLRR
jgi:leader peptidase (prepilin peptidase)/N-methyltransferase